MPGRATFRAPRRRPLLFRRRKFDVRQWVLVTSVAPLVVWGFSECYARFASQPWALDDASLANELAHLCNFSVQKNAAIDDSGIPENMWDEKTLAAAVDSVFGIGAFREQLRPAFRGLGIAACRAAAASGMKKVARGFEWLGLDVLIADDLSCHLLEVNARAEWIGNDACARESSQSRLRGGPTSRDTCSCSVARAPWRRCAGQRISRRVAVDGCDRATRAGRNARRRVQAWKTSEAAANRRRPKMPLR